MPSLVLDCPHCGANKMAFTFQSSYPHPRTNKQRFVLGSCNACHKPVTASLHYSSDAWDPAKIQGDLLAYPSLHVGQIWPAPDTVEVPKGVPERVATTYREAAEARQRSSWNAACGMYRRAMELGLKQFAPDVEAWKLEKRIDKLAAEHRITPAIQTWAHELRLDGNEALHGDGDADEEMTDQMHHLTHFLLVYLYSLPEQIEAARERRNPPEDDLPA